MGLEEVRKAITRDAEAEAEAILATARAEAAEIVRAAKERVAAERAAFDMETERMLETLGRRELSAANAQSKAIVLEAKRKAVDEAFAQAARTLAELAGPERISLIEGLCARAREEIAVARIRAAAKDVPILGKAFPNASILADLAITGGFIATSADGSVAIDLTFTTLLADVHDRELLPVSETLFGTRNKNTATLAAAPVPAKRVRRKA